MLTYRRSHLLLFSLSLSSLPAAWSAADESTETETEKEDGHHVKARQLHYPNSKLTRFPVPEEKVPWEVFNFHHKTTTCCWLPTSQPHCKTLFIGFRLFQVLCVLQVSFSSYSPAYYSSEDSGDHVDEYVVTNYPVHDIVFVLRFTYAYTVSAVFLLR